MSDGASESTTRFFPYGATCPACHYDLSHATATQCPECGTVLTERMATGRVRAINDDEREFGPSAIRSIGRWELLRGTHTQVWQRYSVLLLVALGPPVLYGLWQFARAEHQGLVGGFLLGGLLPGALFSYGALLLVYMLLMAWTALGVKRRARDLHRRLGADLAAGRVEEWWAEASPRLTIEGAEPIGTYLRMADGTIFGVRNDARHWVGEECGGRIRLARLPTSGIAVGLRSEGPPVTHVRRADADNLRPKRSDIAWITPVVFFENESRAFGGSAAFAGGR